MVLVMAAVRLYPNQSLATHSRLLPAMLAVLTQVAESEVVGESPLARRPTILLLATIVLLHQCRASRHSQSTSAYCNAMLAIQVIFLLPPRL